MIKVQNVIKHNGKSVAEAEVVLVENVGPILISRTEKIEDDDWVYQHNEKSIHKDTELRDGLLFFYEDDLFTLIGNCDKILALPEHFSPEHLQMIVDGKLKDRQRVFVECEFESEQVWPRSGRDGQGFEKYEYFDQVKLNPHITLYPQEESNDFILGVGDGSGNHFVRGDYESIKMLQTKLIDRDKRYTREEMADYMKQFSEAALTHGSSFGGCLFLTNWAQWFEENVK